MKIQSQPLWQFVEDYGLRHIDGKVCFNGVIYFNVNGIYKKIESEIHIVSFKLLNSDTVYLLNPLIPVLDLPSFFQTKDIFTYISKQCLIITGMSPIYGKYIVSIFPENSNCNPDTIIELRGKQWN